MKLAFFTSIVPDGTLTSGFEIANSAIIGCLRELGHQVVVIGFRLPRQSTNPQPDVVVLEDRELENASPSVGAATKLRWLLQAYRSGLPFAAAKLKDYSAIDLDRVIEVAGPFDGYVLNSYQMAAAFPHLCHQPHIYVAHNLEHLSATQNAEASSSMVQRALYRRDARLLRLLEAQLRQGADYVWAFSEADLIGLGLNSIEAGCTLPLIVPGSSQLSDVEKSYDAGLIGTWSWQPNLVGLMWFTREVLPLLPDHISIAVAGSVPEIAKTTDPRISYLGRVKSAQDFLNSVRVVPLVGQGGTGVPLKTIEAFQAGLACVATSSSLRGIDTLPKNCLDADSATAFAEGLNHLIQMEKSGQLPQVDGAEFQSRQKSALKEGLARGVAALA